MRSAVQKLADEGLQHIEYDNPGKRYYRRRLDSSVRNAFSGGMQRLSQAQNERLGRQFGADGMEVTFHRGARPTHAEMGGRQYPMKQYNSEIVPLLMENNCYHRAFPILLGISPPTYGGKELAALKAQDAEKHTFEGKEYNAYEARQMQRRMETAIRRQKDRAVAAGRAGDKEAEQTALIKGAALNQKYAQFSGKMELAPKVTRVTAGLNRSQAARLGAQTRKLNKKWTEDALTWYAEVAKSEPEISRAIQEIGKQNGMETAGFAFRLKSKDSFLRKVLGYKKQGKHYSEAEDVVRYTYLNSAKDLTEGMHKAVAAFQGKGYAIKSVRNTWANPNIAYKGINANLTSPSGTTFELQFHTPESFELKDGAMHKLYEQQRVLVEDSNEWIALEDEMKALSAKLTVPAGIDTIESF